MSSDDYGMIEPPKAILLGCVKLKVDHDAPARDLYRSPLWRRRRAYAEGTGLPWLILSAKYGLIEPDLVIPTYDMALAELPAAKRRTWGDEAVATLETRFGSLLGATFEVHAGSVYRIAIEAPITKRGGSISVPLVGVSIGTQLAWYKRHAG